MTEQNKIALVIAELTMVPYERVYAKLELYKIRTWEELKARGEYLGGFRS
jgi:hypothetical protein